MHEKVYLKICELVITLTVLFIINANLNDVDINDANIDPSDIINQ